MFVAKITEELIPELDVLRTYDAAIDLKSHIQTA
jgi:hypothetical protein